MSLDTGTRKSNDLCYALGIDGGTLEYIVDDSKMKQGFYMPGTHIQLSRPTRYTLIRLTSALFSPGILQIQSSKITNNL